MRGSREEEGGYLLRLVLDLSTPFCYHRKVCGLGDLAIFLVKSSKSGSVLLKKKIKFVFTANSAMSVCETQL